MTRCLSTLFGPYLGTKWDLPGEKDVFENLAEHSMAKYCMAIILLLFIYCSKNYDFSIVHFHNGTTEIIESDSVLLYENLSILHESPEINIVLEGYTNTVGGDSANLVLSQARADTIESWLIAHEVEGNRITAVGYGESDPVADNRTSSGRALNDRVEFKTQ